MKHSPEPWKVGKTCVGYPAVFSSDGTNRAAALFGNLAGDGSITALPNQKEDAARIVECVNAMAGIENPSKAILAARGALEMVDESMKARWETPDKHPGNTSKAEGVLKRHLATWMATREALAKLKGAAE